MSEFGFLAFGLPEETNPVEAAQKKAAAIEKIRQELDERGIISFALKADSAPEVEQRLLMREVNAAIDEIVERNLPGDDDAKKRVVSSIFRQFEASKEAHVNGKEHSHTGPSTGKCDSCGTDVGEGETWCAKCEREFKDEKIADSFRSPEASVEKTSWSKCWVPACSNEATEGPACFVHNHQNFSLDVDANGEELKATAALNVESNDTKVAFMKCMVPDCSLEATSGPVCYLHNHAMRAEKDSEGLQAAASLDPKFAEEDGEDYGMTEEEAERERNADFAMDAMVDAASSIIPRHFTETPTTTTCGRCGGDEDKKNACYECRGTGEDKEPTYGCKHCDFKTRRWQGAVDHMHDHARAIADGDEDAIPDLEDFWEDLG